MLFQLQAELGRSTHLPFLRGISINSGQAGATTALSYARGEVLFLGCSAQDTRFYTAINTVIGLGVDGDGRDKPLRCDGDASSAAKRVMEGTEATKSRDTSMQRETRHMTTNLGR